jgi:hypothetical protein
MNSTDVSFSEPFSIGGVAMSFHTPWCGVLVGVLCGALILGPMPGAVLADPEQNVVVALQGTTGLAGDLPIPVQVKLSEILRADLKKDGVDANVYAKAYAKMRTAGIDHASDITTLRNIQLKYEITCRNIQPILTQQDTELARLITRESSKGPVQNLLVKGTANPVRNLLSQTTDKVLNDGVSRLLKPGIDQKSFVSVQWEKGKEQAFLENTKGFVSAGVAQASTFKSLPVEEQAGIVRGLQLQVRSRSSDPQVGRLIGSEQAQSGKDADACIKQIQALREVSAKIVDHKVQCSQQLSEDATIIKDDVKIIKRVLASQLNAADQLKVLGKDADKAEVSKLKTQAAFESAEKYVEAGGALVALARSAGLKGNTVDAAAEVLSKAKSLVQFGSALAKSDPIGAISALASLIFGGGPDPAEERHKEVMEKLGVLEGKLDAVLKNQQLIYDKLVGIEKKLDELTIEVKKNHVEVMTKLDELQHNVLTNREVLFELLKRDLHVSKVASFVEIEKKKKTYAEKVAWFNNFSELYSRADNGLAANLPVGHSPPEISSYFKVKLSTNQEVQAYLEKAVVPLFDLFLKRALADEYDSAVSRLLEFSFTVRDLDRKLATKPLLPVKSRRISQEHLRDLLFAQFIHDYANDVTLFCPYIFLVDKPTRPTRLLSAKEVQAQAKKDAVDFDTKRENKAVPYLQDPLFLVNVAIAQRTLLSGDALLPVLYEQILANTIEDKTIDLLTRHPILARNLATYFLVKRVQANGGNTFSYSFAFNSKDKDYLSALTRHEKTYFQFARSKVGLVEDGKLAERESWCLRLRQLLIPLPVPNDFDVGQLIPVDEMIDLYQLRHRLIDEIASYDLPVHLSQTERAALTELALLP